MRGLAIFTLITLSFFSAKAQTEETKSSTIKSKKESKQNFANQGEQENYWVEKFFEEKYIKQLFKRFKDSIIITNSNIFTYADKTFEIINTSPELKIIFKKGIFYPDIITGNFESEFKSGQEPNTVNTGKIFYNLTLTDSFTISNLEELKFLNKTPTIKRFKFLLYTKNLVNPTVCFIELTNENAKLTTDLSSFIDGSTLTFFKQGWIMV